MKNHLKSSTKNRRKIKNSLRKGLATVKFTLFFLKLQIWIHFHLIPEMHNTSQRIVWGRR